MIELSNVVKLSHCVKILVPSRNLEDVKSYAAELSRVYGGCTIYPGINGTWVNDLGELIDDPIIILESYYQDQSIDHAIEIAATIKTEFNQDAVSLINDNSLYLI